MGTGALESNSVRFMIEFINKNPVALNMTFEGTFPFAVKRVVTTFRRQRLFAYNHAHYFNKFIYILMTFFGSNKFLFEFPAMERFKHKSTTQFRKQFLKRITPLDGNLSIRNGYTFLNGGNSLGIVARIPGYAVNVLGADGARVRMDMFAGGLVSLLVCYRGEGNYRLPFRHFTGNINGQPVTGGYIYGPCNTQKIYISRKKATQPLKVI